ncbi:MAG TPA: AMP-binding protein [Egibacteraceae bacterium]|nr:AMP-binding protein [Egibacteraceae bacterium]
MELVGNNNPADRPIGRALAVQAEAIGDKVFVRTQDEAHTFAEVNARACRLANSMRDLGIKRGDPVAILMEDGYDFVSTVLAVNKAGGIWVPINTNYRGDWLSRTLQDAAAAMIVADDAYLAKEVIEQAEHSGARLVVRKTASGAAAAEGRPGATTPFDALEDNVDHEIAEPLAESDISAVMWTSGTTGRSKGVMQAYGCWYGALRLYTEARDVRPDDVFYNCLPMFNSGAWVFNILEALYTGTTVAIDPVFSVSRFWERVQHYGATQIATLGAMHMYLWQQPPQPAEIDNPARVATAIPVPPEIHDAFKERFGLEHIVRLWGQSELMPLSINSPERQGALDADGFVRDDFDVMLLDEHDNEVAAGEVGEICVRPRRPFTMFQGYYRNPQATVDAWRNLWYHSGDLGTISESGELRFVDRKADYIRYKGRNISSIELEGVVMEHPDVVEAAAHGVPSSELLREDEIKVCVVRKLGAEVSEADLATHVNERAPYFLVPRYIEFVDELPHTPTGRVRKVELRERGVTSTTWDRVAAGFTVQR